MLYNVEPEFIEMYNSIENILFDNYSKVASKSGLDNLENDLNSLAYDAYYSALKHSRSAVDEDKKEVTDIEEKIALVKDDADFTVFKFIALAALSSFFGLSHLNDLTGAVEGDDIDKFGYDGSLDNLKKLCRLTSKSEDNFEKGAFQRLLASQRKCSCKEYFDNKKYITDVKRVKRLIEHHITTAIIDEELQGAIVTELGDIMESELAIIVEVYTKILAAAFGLDKYVGVFTFSNTNPVIGLNKSYNYTDDIKPPEKLRGYASLIKRRVDVLSPYGKTSYTDRQFEADVIYNNFKKNPEKATYFPHKILEIVSLGEWTSTKAHAYKACNGGESKNLKSYINYLKQKFEADMLNYVAYCCNNDYLYLSKETQDNYKVADVLYDIDCADRAKFKSGIIDKIKYYTKCVTTIVALTELSTEKSKFSGIQRINILSFRIKVAYDGELIDNKQFCAELGAAMYKNASKFSDAENCAVEKTSTGISLVDYSYTFNAEKVYSRPIFAYKALEALSDQGMTLDWRNILLGKYADGSLCRSSSGEKIVLQDVKLHNIYAGSRSGKGVMCFNLFATAIASKLPIFYIDRKPDTAVILKALGSNMFAVNGGQYSSEIDLEKQFVPGNINFKIPSYLEPLLNDDSIKNDYIYFRAMLLVFCLIIFMDKTENKSHPLYQKITQALGAGAIFVFDEFTNFVNKFLAEVPTTQNWFKECYSVSGLNEWKKLLSNVNSAAIDLQAKQNAEKQNEAQIAKAQGKVESSVDDAKGFSLENIYFAQLADDYKAVVTTIPELFRAGGSFVKQAQIFIIGQEIPLDYYDGDNYFTSSNGRSTKRFNSSTHKAGDATKPNIPMIKMLNNMAGDYILGYQPPGIGKPNYLAQNNKNMISASMLTAARRCFCYYRPDKPLDYSGALQLTDTAKAFGSNEARMKSFLNEFTYFKPFLILNNAVQPPPELLYTADGSSEVDSELENKRKGSAGFEQYAQSQYVGQCLTSCNRAGLTWDDLLNDNPSPNDPETLHGSVGFEGYIREMSQLSGGGGAVPVDELNLSGEVMTTFVNEVFGYRDGNWLDFLADFRPEALFKPQDFINAIDKPELNTVQSRLISSFFCPALTKESGDMSFASIFERELGTLAQYYAGASVDEDIQSQSANGTKSGFTDEEPEQVDFGEEPDGLDEDEIDDDLGDLDVGDDDVLGDKDFKPDDDDDLGIDDDDMLGDDDNLGIDNDEDGNDTSEQKSFKSKSFEDLLKDAFKGLDEPDDDKDSVQDKIYGYISETLEKEQMWESIWDNVNEDDFVEDILAMYDNDDIDASLVAEEMAYRVYDEAYAVALQLMNNKLATCNKATKNNIIAKFGSSDGFAKSIATQVAHINPDE